ncbi:hypothetical protein PP178_03955 [Zeaxanthinibacter sp. PT1]|uniref:hypothetical protein n=1 Tax=Zeaxanthinibacter TaxID=561554 RepID=UPI00234B4918|nr:hypothetical protein [Zeaxanthinibacter sp. PT1]MDC6350694.1 hypothetical protein [Zeaxanthinibacter sp. PT1]
MALSTASNISLSQVITEIGLPSDSSLADCIANVNSSGWHSSYSGSKDRLSNFRGYNHSAGGTYQQTTAARSTSSSSNACSIGESTYWIDQGTNFGNTTKIYRTSSGTLAYSGWYAKSGQWRYWSGSAFTSSGLCTL